MEQMSREHRAEERAARVRAQEGPCKKVDRQVIFLGRDPLWFRRTSNIVASVTRRETLHRDNSAKLGYPLMHTVDS